MKRRMNGSVVCGHAFLVMGALLARLEGENFLPGSCAIGARPIDLRRGVCGARGGYSSQRHGFVEAHAERKPAPGLKFTLTFRVSARHRTLMAAVLAEGRTVINAAEEPEIVGLITFLNSMGANIRQVRGRILSTIEGVRSCLGSCTVIPDRIGAGTFMVAAAMTGGDVYVENAIDEHLKPLVAKLKSGAMVYSDVNGVRVVEVKRLQAADVKTLPYQGFKRICGQFMALTTVAEGTSRSQGAVFENRFAACRRSCGGWARHSNSGQQRRGGRCGTLAGLSGGRHGLAAI